MNKSGIEHPIIFSTEMVKAILEGRKTMTRRIIKPQPAHVEVCGGEATLYKDNDNEMKWKYQVGDRLWVKETFVIENDMEYGYSEEELKQWEKDRPIKTENGGFDWGIYHLIPHYKATEPEPNIVPDYVDDFDDKTRWSPSIFMPRWASRITLEITGIRVERLQEITPENCLAEGICGDYTVRDGWPVLFGNLWDSLNAKRGYGWSVNAWVWVIEFRLCQEWKSEDIPDVGNRQPLSQAKYD